MSLWPQPKIFLHSAFSTQSVSLQDFSSHSKTSGSSGTKLNEKSTYLKSEEKWLFETGAYAAPQGCSCGVTWMGATFWRKVSLNECSSKFLSLNLSTLTILQHLVIKCTRWPKLKKDHQRCYWKSYKLHW